jgi:uncharacterized protein (DUF433 family)
MQATWQSRIESDPRILRGKPCIRDTRIPVALILGYLAAGKQAPDILADFPDLNTEDIAVIQQESRTGKQRS